MSKEEVIVIVDFSITKMIIKDGIVTIKKRLYDIGGALTADMSEDIKDEVDKALMLIK